MKNSLFAICIMVSFMATANCDNTYSSASYALNHTRKSFVAKNFDHQKYYAGKALEALEKAQRLVKQCGCNKALIPILQGIENLEKAIGQKDWDMGRYYTKKALNDTQQIIEFLDVYTNEHKEESPQSPEAGKDAGKYEKTLQLELSALEKQLLKITEEQKKLLERKKSLEAKLNKQTPSGKITESTLGTVPG